MSATQTFEFNGYKIRPAVAEDLPRIAQWISADPDHRGKIPARHFTDQAKLVDSYVIEDKEGEVFYFRLDRAVRCTIQFGHGDRKRTAKALEVGMGMMEVLLGISGTREFIFDSQSPLLRAFCKRQLKFTEKPNTLSKTLPILAHPAKCFQGEPAEEESIQGDTGVNS